VKFGMRVQTWDSLPKPNFIKKITEGGIPLSGKFIPKITNFVDLGGCKPTF